MCHTKVDDAASAQAQSTIPIMLDQWSDMGIDFGVNAGRANAVPRFNHVPGGSNVLFMDGHVEFIRYAEMGAFPVNGPFAAIVELVGYL